MSESNTELVAEYVEVLKAEVSRLVEEAVALKARLQYSDKIIQDGKNRVVELQNEIGRIEEELEATRSQKVVEKEVVKEVVVKEKDSDTTKALRKENDFLKKELNTLEQKIKKLKGAQEIRNGDNTEAETLRDSQFSTDYE